MLTRAIDALSDKLFLEIKLSNKISSKNTENRARNYEYNVNTEKRKNTNNFDRRAPCIRIKMYVKDFLLADFFYRK